MTRRLALTILLTVWATILVAGVAAWATARAVLLADFDDSIVHRAAGAAGGTSAPFPGDRFVVKGDWDRTMIRTETPAAAPPSRVIDASFVRLPGGRFRRLTLRVKGTRPDAPLTVIYSADAAGFDRILRELALTLGLGGVLAGAVAALASIGLARVALGPLRHTARAIGNIDPSHLDRRIDQTSVPPELRDVTGQLNEMLGRLETAFERRRHFLADASHELRTPVAALMTTIEVALRRPRPAEELAEALDTCLIEARHMRQIVQALLRQVRAENDSTPHPVETFDVGAMVVECVRVARPLAVARRVSVEPHVTGAVPIRSEPDRLRSVVMNLVGNAIEHNRPGGNVDVRVRADNGFVEIEVQDTGPGIPPEQVPHVFEPFFQGRPARDADDHLGLGLFLVSSHVRAIGGECRVESETGVGTIFRVRVPAERKIFSDATG